MVGGKKKGLGHESPKGGPPQHRTWGGCFSRQEGLGSTLSPMVVLETAAKSECKNDGQCKGIVFHPDIMAGS